MFEIADRAANALERLLPIVKSRFPNHLRELNNVIDEFLYFAEMENGDVNEFDYITSLMYDWADTKQGNGKRLCQINGKEER